MIKKWEGCRLQAYLCPGNVWSIGYGHTGDDVYAGKTITQKDADLMLEADLTRFGKHVNNTVPFSLSQNQFDALVSFTFNLGVANLKKLIKNRDDRQIAEAMLLYVNAVGKPLSRLMQRRAEERMVFLSGTNTDGETEDNVVQYSLKEGGKTLVSANFQVSEFRCRDGSDSILIDVAFVREKLQAIRTHFGVPVIIHSGYRTESHNKKTGGSSGSYHRKGRAFDIAVKGKTPLEVARYAQEIGIQGIIQYHTFVHVDSRTVKYWAVNSGSGVNTAVDGF